MFHQLDEQTGAATTSPLHANVELQNIDSYQNQQGGVYAFASGNVTNNSLISKHLKQGTQILFFFQLLMILLFFGCVKTVMTDNFVDQYQMYTGIIIMVIFGFGYLYAFLRRYGK